MARSFGKNLAGSVVEQGASTGLLGITSDELYDLLLTGRWETIGYLNDFLEVLSSRLRLTSGHHCHATRDDGEIAGKYKDEAWYVKVQLDCLAQLNNNCVIESIEVVHKNYKHAPSAAIGVLRHPFGDHACNQVTQLVSRLCVAAELLP